MDGSRGGGDRGPDPSPPPKYHKHVGFPSNTGQDPLKNHKATKTSIQFGPSSARQRNTIFNKRSQGWAPADKTAHGVRPKTIIKVRPGLPGNQGI